MVVFSSARRLGAQPSTQGLPLHERLVLSHDPFDVLAAPFAASPQLEKTTGANLGLSARLPDNCLAIIMSLEYFSFFFASRNERWAEYVRNQVRGWGTLRRKAGSIAGIRSAIRCSSARLASTSPPGLPASQAPRTAQQRYACTPRRIFCLEKWTSIVNSSLELELEVPSWSQVPRFACHPLP